MKKELLDFPSYVNQTQKTWDKPIGTAFDEDGVPDHVVRDVIEELEYIRDSWASRSRVENWDAVREQARRLTG
ncbi:hypothetical protein ACQCN2_00880 [Brevibacillus ginsengisoli]|uniref:hypothetical protein n=1 Tax=Brevibacillus ginsengisoli TaxID=363854 RepID=UPI003CE91A52